MTTADPMWAPEVVEPTADFLAPLARRGVRVTGIDLSPDVVTEFPVVHELDLMARLAGLELHERVAGWDPAPFLAESRSHVSVWRKPR